MKQYTFAANGRDLSFRYFIDGKPVTSEEWHKGLKKDRANARKKKGVRPR